MKKLITIVITAIFIALNIYNAHAQNQSMTIQHTGLAPNDTLWVMPGDSIDFIYGGGGNHPMTSGQGANPSPVFFPTVTVNSTTTMATFALNTIGTYIFHCGTNPGNTNNWGTIIVMSSSGIDESNTNRNFVNIYPNPSQDQLIIKLQNNETANYTITDLSGKLVKSGKVNSETNKVDISNFVIGNYLFKLALPNGIVTKKFIKN
jgi:plastocyanin